MIRSFLFLYVVSHDLRDIGYSHECRHIRETIEKKINVDLPDVDTIAGALGKKLSQLQLLAKGLSHMG